MPNTKKKYTPVTQSRVGAIVQYCGHDASFVADIVVKHGVAVVIGNPKVESNLTRPASPNVTNHVIDAGALYWGPLRGFFVVPVSSCFDVK